MSTYTESSVPGQQGETIFVTGANTGVGFEAARVLVGKGTRAPRGGKVHGEPSGPTPSPAFLIDRSASLAPKCVDLPPLSVPVGVG
jgi:hypothetical protein